MSEISKIGHKKNPRSKKFYQNMNRKSLIVKRKKAKK